MCVETQLSAAGIQQVTEAGSCISDELPGDAATVLHRDTLGREKRRGERRGTQAHCALARAPLEPSITPPETAVRMA